VRAAILAFGAMIGFGGDKRSAVRGIARDSRH
jgi:hypothetical protein